MLLIKPLLGLFFKDLVEESAKKVVADQVMGQIQDQIRVEFLRTVAEGFSREVEHNLSQYVQSVGAVTATLEVSGGVTGETLFTALQSSLKTLEVELENLGPDSPVVEYLMRRYGTEPETLVGRNSVPVYQSVLSGSARAESWLNRDSTVEGLISLEAAKLLEDILQDEILSAVNT